MKQLNSTLITTAILLTISTSWAADRGTVTQPELAPVAPRQVPAATPVPIPRPTYTAPVRQPARDATPVPIPKPARVAPAPYSEPVARPRPQRRPVYPQAARPAPQAAPAPNPRYIPQPVMREPQRIYPRQFRPDYPYHPDMRGQNMPGRGMPGGGYSESTGYPSNPYGSFGMENDYPSGRGGVGPNGMGMPGIYMPGGAMNPQEMLVTPERGMGMGPGGSVENLYGPTIPGKDPGGGNHGGWTGTEFGQMWSKMMANMIQSIIEPRLGIPSGLFPKIGGHTDYKYDEYINVEMEKKDIETEKKEKIQEKLKEQEDKQKAEKNKSSGQIIDEGSDAGRHPWTKKDQETYDKARSAELYNSLTKGPVVGSGGKDPVDPDQKAQGEGANSSQSDKSQAGQAPQAATPAVVSTPGEGLVGPSDDVTGIAPIKQQLVLPKGFHVVDPAARKAISDSSLDEEMGAMPPSVK